MINDIWLEVSTMPGYLTRLTLSGPATSQIQKISVNRAPPANNQGLAGCKDFHILLVESLAFVMPCLRHFYRGCEIIIL